MRRRDVGDAEGFERRVEKVLGALSEGARTPLDIARRTGLGLREVLVALAFLEATRRIKVSQVERCGCSGCRLRGACPVAK